MRLLPIGRFEISVLFIFFPGISVCLTYIICCLLLLQKQHNGPVVEALVEIPLGPGFESQVPQNVYLIFLQVFPRDTQKMVYRVHPIPKRQMASKSNLKARIGASTIRPSQ